MQVFFFSEIKFVHSNGKTSSIISFNTIKYQSISSYVRDGPIPNVHVLIGNAHIRNLPEDMHPFDVEERGSQSSNIVVMRLNFLTFDMW